jgi:hypothetical protein
VAADNDPTRTLTLALTEGPASATLDSATGVFAWRPGAAYAGTTNTVTLTLTDNNVPPLSAAQTFTVAVNTLSSPVPLVSERFAGGRFQFDVNGPVGPTYIVESASSLPAPQWNVLETITPVTSPFMFVDTNSAGTARFYRVVLAQ